MKFSVLLIVLLLTCFSLSGNYKVTLESDSAKNMDAIIKLKGDSDFFNTNFSRLEELSAKAGIENDTVFKIRGLIQFDFSVIPANAIIEKASLSLFAIAPGHNKDNTGNAMLIKRITSEWESDSVTWANQPKTDSVKKIVVQESDSAMQNYVIDVTGIVQDMVDNPSKSNGFMLQLEKETGSNSVVFGSGKNKDRNKRPALFVEYRLPVVEFISKTITAEEKNTATYLHIKFSDTLKNDATIKLAYNNKTARYGEDILFNSSSIVIKAGRISDSIRVTIIDDDYYEENDETIEILLAYANGADIGLNHSIELIILKNDEEAVNLNYGLYAYYPFEKNANDLSGNKRNAIDSSKAGYQPGVNGNALKFNGKTDFVYIPHTFSDAYTYSFWTKMQNDTFNTPFGSVVSATGLNSQRVLDIQVWDTRDTTKTERLYVSFLKSGSLNEYEQILSMIADSTDSVLHIKDSVLFIRPSKTVYNEWTHCVVNVSSKEIKLWINGEIAAVKKRFFTDYSPNVSPVFIGRSAWKNQASDYNYYNGLIDELRIYSRALTSNEIKRLFSEGAFPKVDFLSASSECLENGKIYNIPLSLSEMSYHDITIEFKVTGGTAKDTADYILSDSILYIPPMKDKAYIPVNIRDDVNSEPDETLQLTITSVTGGIMGSILSHTLTILANDLDTFDLGYGLMAYYPFENHTNDLSGKGNHGIDFGSSTYHKGVVGNAKMFDGKNDLIRLNNTIDVSKGLSFSFWIYSLGAAENENNGIVISKYYMDKRQSFYISSFGSDTNRTYNALKAIFFSEDFDKFDFIGSDSASQSILLPTLTPQKIELKKWMHCVVNLSEKNLDIWINNVFTGTSTRQYFPYFNSAEPVYIGNSNWMEQGANNHFNGYMDEFRIYNRPLCRNEIEALFNEGKDNMTSKPVGMEFLSVYPNPASTEIFISTPGNETINIMIYNLTGNKILEQKVTGNRIDLKNLTSGMYILKIENGFTTDTRKLIIKK